MMEKKKVTMSFWGREKKKSGEYCVLVNYVYKTPLSNFEFEAKSN